MMGKVKSLLVWLLCCTLGIVLFTLAIWWMGADPTALGRWSAEAHAAIRPWRGLLTGIRWVLWGLLWWHWERVGSWLLRGSPEVMEAQRHQWSIMRNRMIGAMALVEALILLNNVTGD